MLRSNVSWESLSEAIGKLLGKCRRWSPIGKEVACTIDDSDDRCLIGKSIRAIIRAHDPETGMLLMHLTEPLSYEGHYTANGLDMIVAVPAIRWNRAHRLLLTWTVVRLVDSSSFARQDFGRTIATGRLVLAKAAKLSKQIVGL